MSSPETKPLHLRPGEPVEVRSEQEILATLDETGAIDGMPFMPEMLEFCGMRFRVYKRADKTCNTINKMESLRLHDTVHLEGLRCSGSAHGGCQALCMVFWKEAWLKRADDRVQLSAVASNSRTLPKPDQLRYDRERLFVSTQHRDAAGGDSNEIRYRCQATDLLLASTPLPWWDMRQYVRELACGNVRIREVFNVFTFFLFRKLLDIGVGYRALIWSYDRLQSWRGKTPYPFRRGTLTKTPRETLDLQPGELVQVKPYGEILATLNGKNRNHGLFFDAEMVPYCGTTRRVLARVDRILDERTGKMTKLTNDCVILEGAVCRSTCSERRLFCPRSIYPYWREIWLKRVEAHAAEAGQSEDGCPIVASAGATQN